ncbi:hypothetical protein J5N97_026391 [Dioscorea zingiberensis]|uniref:Amino acid transporter transmembrane domain-containing protein n=1 Tax=Dioscorea zingiberensis TaxID=325984 RepID=A0A9D5H6N6_9LILI|nr:hypothetical protein J5N97_026391 [Dioscorea zingiberensis]
MGGGGDGKTPLLIKLSETQDHEQDGHDIQRTGTLWTAIAHIITAVIGSGVLSLAWSTAQLGWIGGPLAMVFFAAVTMIQSSLLTYCYRSPDYEHGHIRNKTYMEAVKLNLGKRSLWICGLFQQTGLYGCSVAYTLTAASSMRAIQKSNCYHKEGHAAACDYKTYHYMLAFGAVQIVFSQIPDFHNMEWLSIVAAAMSFCYSSIGFGLGLAKVIENGTIKGSIGGVAMATTAQKIWRICQGLGDIAFAYPYSLILLEIQDTLKSPPPENQTMKKASMISILITTFFYLCCGCFGYAAFGKETPGNLLTGFGFYEPYWLIDFANACIILHLIGGYQLYSQPIFSFFDRWAMSKFPNSSFVNKFHTIKLPCLPPWRMNLFRLCLRTLWSLIAAQLPGRTDNDVKNHWNTKLKKKLSGMGIDPVTHKPFSHLMAEIATTLAPPQVAHLAEAALGCFKDEMLHLLTKKRVDHFSAAPQATGNTGIAYAPPVSGNDKEETIEKIKLGLSRAIMQEANADQVVAGNAKAWTMVASNGEASVMHDVYPMMTEGFRYDPPPYGNDGEASAWSQSLCTGSTCTGGVGDHDQQGGGVLMEKEEEEDGEEAEGGKNGRKGDHGGMFASDCVLWDLPDDLMSPIV